MPSFRAIQRFGKEWINWNSGNAQLFARYANVRQIFSGFIDGYVVAIDRTANPHGVNVVIGYNDGIMRAQFSFGDQPRNNFRGQKMSGHAQIRLYAL